MRRYYYYGMEPPGEVRLVVRVINCNYMWDGCFVHRKSGHLSLVAWNLPSSRWMSLWKRTICY